MFKFSMSCEQQLANLAEELSGYIVNFSDFELGKAIGHGGFSEVFIGIQRSTGKLCAVKVLKVKKLASDNFTVYKREVEILAKGRNRFLLDFIGFTITYPYAIITEYAKKGTLYDSLHHKISSPILTGTQKTMIAMGIAYAMDKLHSIKVIHRDLKSLNILLDEQCQPKICDFGLSRFVHETGSILTGDIGTPHWMAPELFESHAYTNKVDVYSYGVIIWEMVTGTYPFKGLPAVQIGYQISKQNIRPTIPRSTPPTIHKLIQKCWALQPEKRPSFRRIYLGFAQNMIKFFDTDQNAIQALVNQLKADEARMSESQVKTPHTNSAQNSPSKPRFSLPLSYKSEEQPDFFSNRGEINMDQLINCGLLEFISRIKIFMKSINGSQAIPFFNVVFSRFQNVTDLTNNGTQEMNLEILKATEYVFSNNDNDPLLYRAVVQADLLNKLPYHDQNLQSEVLEILVHIFKHAPEIVTENVFKNIADMAESNPLSILRLINIYTCLNPIMKYFWTATDILFTKSNAFLKLNNTPENYLKLLYTLIALHKVFKQSRFQQIIKVLTSLLTQHTQTVVKISYRILVKLVKDMTEDPPPSFNNVYIHLRMEKFADDAASVLVRLPSSFQFTIPQINNIIIAAKTSRTACYILTKQCERSSIALHLAHNVEDWLQPLPTYDYTIRVLSVILKHSEVKQVLCASHVLQDFLKTLLSNYHNPNIILYVIAVENALPVTAEFIILITKTGILLKLYQAVNNQMSNSTIIYECIMFTDHLCRTYYSNDYLALVPLLKQLVGDPGWQKFAVFLLATLSLHQEAKQEISDSFIYEQMVNLNSNPELSPYSQVYLQNVSPKV